MREDSKVYLDYNATTPLGLEAQQVLHQLLLTNPGNPSSIHWAGQQAKALIRESRSRISSGLAVGPLEIIFTSGATEANNSVLFALAEMALRKSLPQAWAGRNEFITSAIEHPSVLRVFEDLEQRGFKVHRVKVDRQGNFDLGQYKSYLSERTLLVSVMMANNETGSLMPVGKISKLAHNQGALVHTDAVQALGKMSIDLKALNVDYASFSGHKFYAMKGAGFLYVRKGSPYRPLILGGSQERSRRGGTENIFGIVSLGESMRALSRAERENQRIEQLRNLMEHRILNEIPGTSVTGKASRLANTCSLVLDNVDGETLLMSLDLKGFAVSTGAACASGSSEPSPVLLAMGLSRREAQSSLRVSLGWPTQEADVLRFVDELKLTVSHLRKISEDQVRPSEAMCDRDTQMREEAPL